MTHDRENRDGSSTSGRSVVDMTPMVDVTFLLLIFFMVTAAFTLQKSIAIPNPANTDLPGSSYHEVKRESITIMIDADNSFRLITGDDEFECSSKQDLFVRLRAAMSAVSAPTKLIVRVHGESAHEQTIVALDAGADVGLDDIQLVTIGEE
jgi:biopolymer transport protein ExbD